MTHYLLYILATLLAAFFIKHYSRKSEIKIKEHNENKNNSMIHYEDDYRMIEIMSSGNRQIFNENDKDDFQHDGIQITTEQLDISKVELNLIFSKIPLPKYPHLTYLGIGEPKTVKSENTLAYGSLSCGIFFEGNKEVVESIWLASFNFEKINQTKIPEALNVIGNKFDLILVDFYKKEIVDLSSQKQITDYFN